MTFKKKKFLDDLKNTFFYGYGLSQNRTATALMFQTRHCTCADHENGYYRLQWSGTGHRNTFGCRLTDLRYILHVHVRASLGDFSKRKRRSVGVRNRGRQVTMSRTKNACSDRASRDSKQTRRRSGRGNHAYSPGRCVRRWGGSETTGEGRRPGNAQSAASRPIRSAGQSLRREHTHTQVRAV